MNSDPSSSHIFYSCPVTSVQHGMIFHHVSDPSAGVDLEQCVGEFEEALNGELMKRAWGEVSARYEVLHGQFRWEGLAHPLFDVLGPMPPSVCLTDLCALNSREQKVAINEYLVNDRSQGFDFSKAPLHRVQIFLTSEKSSTMVWTYSHATLDSSTLTVLREVLEAYDAYCKGIEPLTTERAPFSKHLNWLSEHVKRQACEAEEFFRKQLDGFITPTGITPRTDGASVECSQGVRDLRLSAEITQKLERLGAEHALSLNHFFQGAWALILAQHAASHDVVFGVTRACRRTSLPELSDTVGLFINTLPLRVKVRGSVSTIEWLQALREQNHEMSSYEHTPLVDVQRCSRLPSGAALFSSILVFNSKHNNTQLHLDGVSGARNFDWIDQTNFPMTLFGYGDDSLLLRISYQRKTIEDAMAQTLLRQMEAVLTDMAENPKKSVRDLRLIGLSDLTWLAQRKGEEVACSELALPQLFERQVEKTPHKIALTYNGKSLTYAELNGLSNVVARRLESADLKRDECVGLYVSRSLEMVVGLLGILKAGGAYVPLDPKYPQKRLAMMIEDSQMGLILAPVGMRDALPEHTARMVELSSAEPGVMCENLGHSPQRTDLAYVIFTSGSTGRPKGVMVEHRHVMSFFAGMDARIGKEAGVWLAVTSISFDISVLELFWTLTRGFHVVLQHEEPDFERKVQEIHALQMEFGLFYFGGEAGIDVKDKYRLLLEGSKYADENSFSSVWTPERHFHEFGGLYPNPALTGAAIAACTKRIHIRAGSVVAPLHHPVRLAEEWSVVDNISGGRVGFSVASGWHPNDFVLAPDRFEKRRELMFEHLEDTLALWRGGSLSLRNGLGEDTLVKTYPRPIQEEPPVWITAGGSPVTFEKAGERGANILTNLLVQSEEELAERIVCYREARKRAGHTGPGKITLMLHTFLGEDVEQVREKVRGPLTEYLKTATALVNRTRWELTTFATGYKGKAVSQEGELPSLDVLSDEERRAIYEHAFNRYFEDQGLFGTASSCVRIVDRFRKIGVDEVACLIDFGLDTDVVLDGLKCLNDLRLACNQPDAAGGRDFDLAMLIEKYNVSHFQCTPSLARMICADAEQLNALKTVDTILLGGEALPLDLAQQVTEGYEGRLLNMYGPTETTVWSASSQFKPGAIEVTIGSANANTSIVILDAEKNQVSPGVAGEIYIGGQSVARGYIHRADLTAERFVTLDVEGQSARYYRTGDWGRYRSDGEIEFLGRTDHQVKISGHRIELGEIESVLAQEPEVAEVAVVAREDNGGQTQLVAYVVSKGGGTPANAGLSDTWRETWDQTYASADFTDNEQDLDTAGWISSLTGEPISECEMKDWVRSTVDRILSLEPKKVLEVGCGTGMLALGVAPHCEHYTGVDFSESALARFRKKLEARGVHNVSLKCAAADELSELQMGTFDVIVVNSVAQYFPGHSYLLQVIQSLVRHVSPGGYILFGDVRDLRQQEAFYLSAELGA